MTRMLLAMRNDMGRRAQQTQRASIRTLTPLDPAFMAAMFYGTHVGRSSLVSNIRATTHARVPFTMALDTRR